MKQNKTIQTESSVAGFISSVPEETKRDDSFRLVELFKSQTGFEPKMWGTAIIGFGSYHYQYDSGREGDAPLVAFSPRKNALVLYLSSRFDQRESLLQQLGKHKTGKGCIYINKLDDIRTDILKEIVSLSVEQTKREYPSS